MEWMQRIVSLRCMVTYAEFLVPAHRMLNGRRIGITKSITDAYAFA